MYVYTQKNYKGRKAKNKITKKIKGSMYSEHVEAVVLTFMCMIIKITREKKTK